MDDDADLARRLYRALAEGDRAALDELLDPEFVGRLAEGMPGGVGGEHRGAAAMRKAGWGGIARHFAAAAEPAEMTGLADGRLLVTGQYRGTGRRGGGQVDAAFAHVLSFSAGRITALEQYTDTARWAAAAPPLRRLTLAVDGGVATVRLDRPSRGNAVDVEMGEDLATLATTLAEDTSIRAVALSGNGGVFCVGADIAILTATPPQRLPDRARRMVDDATRAIERLTALDAPLVVGVTGPCAGLGLCLVGAADIVIAAENATFTVGYGGLGLTADGGLTWFLPRLIGLRRTQELFLTNRTLTAAEALEWGLVTAVVAADAVDDDVAARASRLAAGPTRAFGSVRRLLRQSFDTDLTAQLVAEQRSIVDAAGTADAVEGVTAFAERRRPVFTGR